MNEMQQWEDATQAASTITTAELDEWGRKYNEAWAKYEVAKEASGDLYRAFEEIEGKFVEAMQLAGKSKYVVEGVGTFSFSERLSVQTPKTAEEKKLLAKYLEKKNLFWQLFGINSQSLQAFYKAEFEEHKKLCETQGLSDPFHIPGLNPPTAVRTLKMTTERKK